MTRTHVLFSLAAVLAVVTLVARGGPSPASGSAPTSAFPSGLGGLPSAPVELTAEKFRLQSDGQVLLAARLSNAEVPKGNSRLYLEANVRAEESQQAAAVRAPLNLALVIDRSGSMAGQKLAQARAAAVALVDALHDGDQLAVVNFGSDVQVFTSTPIDAASRTRLRAHIEGLVDRGGTNLSGGLKEAWDQLRHHQQQFQVSRVLLLSDGQPTEGETNPAALINLAASAREQGLTTSAFGVGLDFNATLMRGLANSGAGYYAFVEDASQVKSVFAQDLETASRIVARRVTLELTCAPGVTLADVPGRTWVQSGNTWKVSLYDLAAGQSTQVLFQLALEGAPASGAVPVATVAVRYLGRGADAPTGPELALAAAATEDAERVKASTRADVVELAEKMEVAKHLTVAARAYESGDRATALSKLNEVRALFGTRADALAGDDLLETEKRMRAGDEGGNRAAKSLVDKSMRSFGQNNTYTN